MKLTKKLLYYLAIGSVLGAVGYSAYYYITQDKVVIYDYNYHNDAAAIKNIFMEDRDLLLAPGAVNPEQYIDFLLEHQAAIFEPNIHETIKVLHEGKKVAGFITYSRKNFYRGKIRLLGIGRAYRGKGYGTRLLEYAKKDLINQGCTVVYLTTRKDNYPAQSIYKKAGLKQTKVLDDDFVRFEYQVD
ncbi:MAG: GNAT family N-acetyltransferase [Candidatus Babeliales bacterium]